MGVAELRTAHSLPPWTTAFLRERCAALTADLTTGNRGPDPDAEADGIHCWRLLLLAAADLPVDQQVALEELQVLHARIAARVERGGLADLAPELDELVRTILAERLQRLTDAAIRAVGG